jgi:Ser-tRNA(Ala) deacylase AlaX
VAEEARLEVQTEPGAKAEDGRRKAHMVVHHAGHIVAHVIAGENFDICLRRLEPQL